VSWLAIAVLVAVVYVCVVTFAIALCRASKRAEEAPDAALDASGGQRRFVREPELELTPEDAEFLDRLGRR
jgi:hypothetical protein